MTEFFSVQNTLFLKLITRKTRKHHLTENQRELVGLHVAIREEMYVQFQIMWHLVNYAIICHQKIVNV